MASNTRASLSPDKPLANPDADRLGYAPFARHLAEPLSRMAPPEGLVAAIYGPWGSGKTTVVNSIVHYLEAQPEEDRPIIVHFNPWWFSGHDTLIKAFFDQLQAAMTGKRQARGRKLTKKMSQGNRSRPLCRGGGWEQGRNSMAALGGGAYRGQILQ